MPPGENGGGSGSGSATPTRESILAEFRDELTALYKSSDVPSRERKLNQRLFKLRLKNRELEQQVEQFQGAKPKDGQVVLSKEDAAEYDAFKKLNLKAGDVATLVKEHGEQKTRLAERDAEELTIDVADALGFPNIEAFGRFLEREKLHVEFETQRVKNDETGKVEDVAVPMCRRRDDEKAKLEPLTEYLEREVPDFVPIFEQAAESGQEETPYAEAGAAPTGSASPSLAAHLARVTAGDPAARREALAMSGTHRPGAGVTMPVTRNARPTTGKAQAEKRRQEAYEEKRKNPEYAQL